MGEQRFQVTFRGRRVEGSDPVEVKTRLARLFRIPLDRVHPMFSGRRVVIKKDLDRTLAEKYRAAMRQCGAVADIEPMPAPTAGAETGTPVSLAPFGATLVAARRVEAPDIDTSAISMARVGETIVEHEPVAPPDIDTSAMSMAAVGETIVEHEPVAPADIDTSAMRLGEYGETLVEPRPVEPPDIDTSALEVDDPR